LLLRFFQKHEDLYSWLQDAEHQRQVLLATPQVDPIRVCTFMHAMALQKDYRLMDVDLVDKHNDKFERIGAYDANHPQAEGRLIIHIIAWNKLPTQDEDHFELARRVVEEICRRSRTVMEVRDDKHQTALHVAAGAGNDEMVQMLLRHGASVWKSSN
jgi:hypothetical protein